MSSYLFKQNVEKKSYVSAKKWIQNTLIVLIDYHILVKSQVFFFAEISEKALMYVGFGDKYCRSDKWKVDRIILMIQT